MVTVFSSATKQIASVGGLHACRCHPLPGVLERSVNTAVSAKSNTRMPRSHAFQYLITDIQIIFILCVISNRVISKACYIQCVAVFVARGY